MKEMRNDTAKEIEEIESALSDEAHEIFETVSAELMNQFPPGTINPMDLVNALEAILKISRLAIRDYLADEGH
jgi:hypothetical protein